MVSSLAKIPADKWMLHLACYVGLISAVAAAYANVYHNAFLYDDYVLILHNQFLRSWSNASTLFVTPLFAGGMSVGSYYRPLQTILYMAAFQIAGPSPLAFHLLNVG